MDIGGASSADIATKGLIKMAKKHVVSKPNFILQTLSFIFLNIGLVYSRIIT
jgi:hypothetical protein